MTYNSDRLESNKLTQKEIEAMNKLRREWIEYKEAGGKLTWQKWKSVAASRYPI